MQAAETTALTPAHVAASRGHLQMLQATCVSVLFIIQAFIFIELPLRCIITFTVAFFIATIIFYMTLVMSTIIALLLFLCFIRIYLFLSYSLLRLSDHHPLCSMTLHLLLQVLLDAKADVHMPNSAGALALHCAAAKGQQQCCELLLARLADANRSCHDGKTALHFAAFQSVLGPAEGLLNAKAEVNAADQFGHTPLVFAVREGHLEVAKLLLEQRADVNCSSLDGAVPLHVAAERSHAMLLRLLLSMRADVHAKGSDGLTALDILAIEGNKDSTQLDDSIWRLAVLSPYYQYQYSISIYGT